MHKLLLAYIAFTFLVMNPTCSWAKADTTKIIGDYEYRFKGSEIIRIKGEPLTLENLRIVGKRPDSSKRIVLFPGEIFRLIDSENKHITLIKDDKKQYYQDKYWINFDGDSVRFEVKDTQFERLGDGLPGTDKVKDFLRKRGDTLFITRGKINDHIIIVGQISERRIFSDTLKEDTTPIKLGTDSLFRFTRGNSLTQLLKLADIEEKPIKEGSGSTPPSIWEKVKNNKVLYVIGLLVGLIFIVIGIFIYRKRKDSDGETKATEGINTSISGALSTQDATEEKPHTEPIPDYIKNICRYVVQSKQVEKDLLSLTHIFIEKNKQFDYIYLLLAKYHNSKNSKAYRWESDLSLFDKITGNVFDGMGFHHIMPGEGFNSSLSDDENRILLLKYVHGKGYLTFINAMMILLQEIRHIPEGDETFDYKKEVGGLEHKFIKTIFNLGYTIDTNMELFSAVKEVRDIESNADFSFFYDKLSKLEPLKKRFKLKRNVVAEILQLKIRNESLDLKSPAKYVEGKEE